MQAPLIVEADVLGASNVPNQRSSAKVQAGSQLARPQQHDSCLAETIESGSSYQAQRCSHLLRHVAIIQSTALVNATSPSTVTRVVGAIDANVVSFTYDLQEAAEKAQAYGRCSNV